MTIMDKLNPDALAECGDGELDARDGVQPVDVVMIQVYARDSGELPLEQSARAFAEWLHEEWNEFDDLTGRLTNGDVINGALEAWRGK